jgi:hypothetical protein
VKLVVKDIHFKGTTFASQGDDAAVCKAIAAALNSVDGADTFGRPFDEFDIMLVEDED